MNVDNTMRNVKIEHLGITEVNAKARARKIFGAVQGIEIDRAITLLDWCSRQLLRQKVIKDPDSLEDILG